MRKPILLFLSLILLTLFGVVGSVIASNTILNDPDEVIEIKTGVISETSTISLGLVSLREYKILDDVSGEVYVYVYIGTTIFNVGDEVSFTVAKPKGKNKAVLRDIVRR